MTTDTKDRTIKGDISNADVILLNKINANSLSQYFEEEVPSISSSKKINNMYHCYRPAYNDYIDLNEKEFIIALRCVAFSTLNMIAFQNKMSAYALGFTDEKIENSAENYSKEKRVASGNVHRLLD